MWKSRAREAAFAVQNLWFAGFVRAFHRHWRNWSTPGSCLFLAFLAALLSGVFTSAWTLLVAGAIGLVLLVGVAWPWLALRGVQVTLRFVDRRGCEGRPAGIVLDVANRWPVPLFGLMIEGLAGLDQPLSLARVAGWTRAEFEHEFVPSVRGAYPLTPIKIATGFPFGIWICRRHATVVNQLLVWPKCLEVPVDLPLSNANGFGSTGTDRRSGNSGDVIGTRLFRRGDLLRDIHWAQSVRQRKWIVAEREAATRLRATLDVHWSTGIVLEQQIRVVAGILATAGRSGVDVELMLGREACVIGPNGRDIRFLLDHLACWQPTSETSPHAELLFRAGTVRWFVTANDLAAQTFIANKHNLNEGQQVWLVTAESVEHVGKTSRGVMSSAAGYARGGVEFPRVDERNSSNTFC